jgi:type I restriction enzyme S subunit
MSEEKNVPEIRFKGFSGEWVEKELRQIATYRNGKAHEQSIAENGSYIVVNSKFVSTNGDVKKYSNEQISPLQKNEICFVLSDVPNGKAIARTFLITEDNLYTLNQRIAGITPSEISHHYFLYILLNRNPYFLKFDDGAKQTNLSVSDVENFTSTYPSPEEQTAIGNTFQNLDNLINQHQQKHDKLSNIKKAMLEKMFPKQGETLPEIRFKGFSGEWEHFTIEYCSKLITKGTTPMTIGRCFVDSGISFVKVESVDEIGSINQSKFAYIDAETDQILARSRIKENDLLISIAGALGRAAIVKKEILPANTNQALAIVRLKNDSPVKVEFLYHFTKTKDFKDFVDASASQGAQPNLSLGDISNVRILAPKKEEQEKIGNYFQKLDALINQHQQQITKLNNIKQACLSKMFV